MEKQEEKKRATKTQLLKHIFISLIVFVALTYALFNFYFPFITNHGESMTIPNLEGMLFENLEEFLSERDLRYQIEPDSGYSSKYPPLAVLKQFPLANAKVKQNRKVYLTLNAKEPPLVKMPSLTGLSLKNAQLELRSLGLALGEIRYKPDFALNTILAQYHQGKEIKEGEKIAKGSKVDFEVADGLGDQNFQMLNLTNLNLNEAVFVLKGYGLKLGDVYYEKEGSIITETTDSYGEKVISKQPIDPGKVFKQNPTMQSAAKVGQSIDLWVVQVDSSAIKSVPSLDDIEE